MAGEARCDGADRSVPLLMSPPLTPGPVLDSAAPSPGGGVDQTSAIASYVRLALAALLAWLARAAFRDPLGWLPILSDIDLAIHEAGHIVFMPFGRMMTILGGSLFQVIFPLFFAVYFARPRRDYYAAAVCTWWSALNLLSVAVYCADARAGNLMLLDGSTGQESDGHDWKNLLKMWHLFQEDTLIAHWMRVIAACLCLASLGVMVWFALRGPGAQSAIDEKGILA